MVARVINGLAQDEVKRISDAVVKVLFCLGLALITQAKMREIQWGVDGFLVYDVGLVAPMLALWDKVLFRQDSVP